MIAVLLTRLMGWVALILLLACVFGYATIRIDALNVKRFDVKRAKPSLPAAARKQPVLRRPPAKFTSAGKAGLNAIAGDLNAVKLGASERLQKVIARAGASSRRTAENLVS